MVNHYLFAAFSILWLLFFVYAWFLSRRQARMRRDLEDLKSRLLGPQAPEKSPR
jgi:CcmD family protein